MRTLALLALSMVSAVAFADPAPFGLEIGKATAKDVRAKYGAKLTGVNKYSNGEMYELDVSGIKFDGLKQAQVIFSQDGRLLAVLATLPQHKFEYVLQSLSGKYQLVSKDIPFVGNKTAKLADGNTEITLSAPHMSFDMEMNYINKDLWKSYKAKAADDQKKKQQAESSQL